MDADRATVTIDQARERCRVSQRTIYNWLRAGRVQFVRTADRKVRIFEDTLFTEVRPAGESRR